MAAAGDLLAVNPRSASARYPSNDTSRYGTEEAMADPIEPCAMPTGVASERDQLRK